MHAEERERLILEAIAHDGLVSFRDLEEKLGASPATIRRDLRRLHNADRIKRVHGGARLPREKRTGPQQLFGTPFAHSITQNLAAKRAIGSAAAALVNPGEGIMIDGGSTTLQMCHHLAGLDCQVLTNSLHIVEALLSQPDSRVMLPSGTVFREQNIVLAPAGEDSMPRFHAPKLFIGASSVGLQGAMQQDVILVAAQRRLIDRAEEVILLVDSSKFRSSSGVIVCELGDIDVLITDPGIEQSSRKMIAQAGVRLIIARQHGS